LNQSIALSERIQAVRRALSTFSHDDVQLHDYEISLGADKVLCLKLGYAVVFGQNGGHTTTAFHDEVTVICQCLVQIYKCSPEYRLRSFRHLGSTEILPLLEQLWKEASHPDDAAGRRQSDGADIEGRTTSRLALSVLQLLRVFSKLTPAKAVLIRYNQATFLGNLLETVFSWVELQESSDAFSSPVFWEALGFVRDLTFRVAPADKEMILHLEGAILVKMCHHCCTRIDDLHPRIQEWFTAVVWNLVLGPSICERLVSQGRVVEGLVRALMFHSAHDKNAGLSTKIKRNAISALGNIVADSCNHTFLFRNAKIANSLALLPRLVNLVNDDCDFVVRRRAMRTIRCLASSKDPKTKSAVQNENLPSFLVEVIARNVSQDDENDYDMQIQACQTAISLSDILTSVDRSNLEKALVRRIETTTLTKLISACCQCLVECSTKSATSLAHELNFTEMFWTRLETAVSTCSESQGSISSLLVQMIKQERLAARPHASSETEHRPSLLIIPPVINSLTIMLSDPDPSRQASRKNALDAITLLVENQDNKRPLAENEGLLSSLVNMCLMQPDPTTKMAAKRVILDLVPEI
jgi:hypothetical protein